MGEMKVSRRGLLKYFGVAAAVSLVPSISVGTKPYIVASCHFDDVIALDGIDHILQPMAQKIVADIESSFAKFMLENAHG